MKKATAAPKLAVKVTKQVVAKKGAAKKPVHKSAPQVAIKVTRQVVTKKGAAHQAHLAHLAHLQHLGLRPHQAAPQLAIKVSRKVVAFKGKPTASQAKKVRKLALGDGVACCAAEAVAASLRLAGRPVSDADVLALYRRTADGPDAGATIWATLEAAYKFGLAGVRPAGFEPVRINETLFQCSGLILGLDLPGPHAVLDDGTGWWSWGELYDPGCWPDAVIEEAWTLAWD